MTQQKILTRRRLAVLAALLLPFDWSEDVPGYTHAMERGNIVPIIRPATTQLTSHASMRNLKQKKYTTRQLETVSSSSCNTYVRKVKVQSTTGEPIHMFELQVLSLGLNVATNGTASQSSTLENFSASYAVDGNMSTFSHTSPDDADPWWEVDLGAVYATDTVILSNRYCGTNQSDPSGCLCRLSNATLSMTDGQGAVVFTQSMGNTCDLPELSFNIPCTTCYPEAKKVKIQSTTGEQIQMFEFQVFSSGVNIARNGTATQSSTLNSLSASLAVDGDMATFSHTNDSDAGWELDFDHVHSVESLTIFNRYCGGSPSDSTGCLCRLSEAELLVLDVNGSPVWNQTVGNTCGLLVLDFDLSSPCPVTMSPSLSPTNSPTQNPVTSSPSQSPSQMPMTAPPSMSPTMNPATPSPTKLPSKMPLTASPSSSPTKLLTQEPVPSSPTKSPSQMPITAPPSPSTTDSPTQKPVTQSPTKSPSVMPITAPPTSSPTKSPTQNPVSTSPTKSPSVMPITASPSVNGCPLNAKKMKIQSTTGEQIQMFEFQVFSSGVNIARNGTATQSSTLSSLFASLAVDSKMASFSHTNDSDAWWELDFDHVHSVESLTIFNRYCGGSPSDSTGCLCRLSEAELLGFDANGTLVWSQTVGDTCGLSVLDFDLSSPCPVTMSPSSSPTNSPTQNPVTSSPSKSPSQMPMTAPPSLSPTKYPTQNPVTPSPTRLPSKGPISAPPSVSPTKPPTMNPVTLSPTKFPSKVPLTSSPSVNPTKSPTQNPVTSRPTKSPSQMPITAPPSLSPSKYPTQQPVTQSPTKSPSKAPITSPPSLSPTKSPTQKPVTHSPSKYPSKMPATVSPSSSPTNAPTPKPVIRNPTKSPSKMPITASPSLSPSKSPINPVTASPSISQSPSLSPSFKIVTPPPSSSKSATPTITHTPTPNPHPTTSLLPTQSPVTAKPTASTAPTYLVTDIVSQPSSSTDVPTPSPVADGGSGSPTFAESLSPSPTITDVTSPPPTFAEAGSPPPTIAVVGSPSPTFTESVAPSSTSPTARPTTRSPLPTITYTNNPTRKPTLKPTPGPTMHPTLRPSTRPTSRPTVEPTSSGSQLSQALLSAISGSIISMFLFM